MKNSSRHNLRSTAWVIFALLAIIVGLYPALYFILNRNFSLLAFKNIKDLSSTAWNIAFYIHIVSAGLALLIGWLQFPQRVRMQRPNFHSNLGKVYIVSAAVGSTSGLYLGFFALGGIMAVLGFVVLGLVWLISTLNAYLSIRKGRVQQHRLLMGISYACCFAAVTLRLWLQLLLMSGISFEIAYPVVAWLCWVPNIAFVLWLFYQKTTTSVANDDI